MHPASPTVAPPAAAGTQCPDRAHLATSADVGQVRQTDASTCGMSDSTREAAILRAGSLVEVFMAERECFEALYARDGCLGHKGAADAARLNAQKAAELQAALVKGRSAAQVARMEEQRGLTR